VVRAHPALLNAFTSTERQGKWPPESESRSRSRARSASGGTTRLRSRSGTRPTGWSSRSTAAGADATRRTGRPG